MNEKKLVGQRLQELRRKQGLSQERLAEKAETSPNYLSRIERGTENPTLDMLIKLAHALDVEMWEMFDFGHVLSGKELKETFLKASSEPGWRNHWKHTGYTPDYSRVRDGLQRLLDEGHADEVVRLGEKLFSKGIDQVEQSHDEGETAWGIAAALKIVFKALGECSLAPVEKMERAVDFGLRDDYDLCQGLEIFWKKGFSKKDWDALAGRLMKRLDEFWVPEFRGLFFS